MNGRGGAQLPDDLRETLDRWLRLWDVPHLEAQSRIEWSPRLTRSLGRCYPDRRLIRISSHLEGVPDGLLQEVLCHEMAHLATRELHGRSVRPHGPEWKALMTSAGFEPRTRLPSPNGAAPPGKRHARYVYLHLCPVCQLSRTARRLMSRWRCAACIASGLEGLLTITRHER
ncbi:MAG TPA: SprT family zinc-dependent metalloprotease [Vicinamibacteria bacterium]